MVSILSTSIPGRSDNLSMHAVAVHFSIHLKNIISRELTDEAWHYPKAGSSTAGKEFLWVTIQYTCIIQYIMSKLTRTIPRRFTDNTYAHSGSFSSSTGHHWSMSADWRRRTTWLTFTGSQRYEVAHAKHPQFRWTVLQLCCGVPEMAGNGWKCHCSREISKITCGS